MAEPRTTGEAIQIIRAALYDVARRPGWTSGATQQTILNYVIEGRRPVPVRDFEKAMQQLIEVGAASVHRASGLSYWHELNRYALTAKGDLEEEYRRRPWFLRVLDEVQRPQTFVDLLKLVVGFVLGLLSGLLLPLLGGHRP